MEWDATKVWWRFNCQPKVKLLATKRSSMEEGSQMCNQLCTQTKQDQPSEDISWFIINSQQKRGNITGYDGFRKILGTKIHVAVESNGLPISIVTSSANEHDSTKFIDVMESISEFVDDDSMKQIATVYADKGYDAACIRNYLRCHGIGCCIPYKKNSKFIVPDNQQNIYNKIRFVVERFFGWLKNGFHRTRIRYEKKCDNYLGFVHLASFLMYWRVLR